MRLVMLDGFVLAAAGTLTGVFFALGIGKVLGALLVGVSVHPAEAQREE